MKTFTSNAATTSTASAVTKTAQSVPSSPQVKATPATTSAASKRDKKMEYSSSDVGQQPLGSKATQGNDQQPQISKTKSCNVYDNNKKATKSAAAVASTSTSAIMPPTTISKQPKTPKEKALEDDDALFKPFDKGDIPADLNHKEDNIKFISDKNDIQIIKIGYGFEKKESMGIEQNMMSSQKVKNVNNSKVTATSTTTVPNNLNPTTSKPKPIPGAKCNLLKEKELLQKEMEEKMDKKVNDMQTFDNNHIKKPNADRPEAKKNPNVDTNNVVNPKQYFIMSQLNAGNDDGKPSQERPQSAAQIEEDEDDELPLISGNRQPEKSITIIPIQGGAGNEQTLNEARAKPGMRAAKKTPIRANRPQPPPPPVRAPTTVIRKPVEEYHYDAGYVSSKGSQSISTTSINSTNNNNTVVTLYNSTSNNNNELSINNSNHHHHQASAMKTTSSQNSNGNNPTSQPYNYSKRVTNGNTNQVTAEDNHHQQSSSSSSSHMSSSSPSSDDSCRESLSPSPALVETSFACANPITRSVSAANNTINANNVNLPPPTNNTVAIHPHHQHHPHLHHQQLSSTNPFLSSLSSAAAVDVHSMPAASTAVDPVKRSTSMSQTRRTVMTTEL